MVALKDTGQPEFRWTNALSRTGWPIRSAVAIRARINISFYDMSLRADLSAREFQALAEFRYQIRRFQKFSEEQAHAGGIEPQQHQLLLTGSR